MTARTPATAAGRALLGDAYLSMYPGTPHHDRMLGTILAIEAEASTALTVERDYEAMRKDRGWPTPMHLRRVADALDTLTAARYGDVLRWFCDLCDAALAGEA